jgi:hypothetical protein
MDSYKYIQIWDSILDEINQAIDFMVIFMDLLLNPDGELWSLQVIILGVPIRRSAGSPRFFWGAGKGPSTSGW